MQEFNKLCHSHDGFYHGTQTTEMQYQVKHVFQQLVGNKTGVFIILIRYIPSVQTPHISRNANKYAAFKETVFVRNMWSKIKYNTKIKISEITKNNKNHL
jgi:hypothetical protein